MKLCRLLLVSSALWAAAPPVPAAEVLDLAAATPGRRGVCVTEMDGGERVEVPLTVLGTIGAGTPEGELVLVRLDDPRFAATGIIAGMSGSPVYLDGELLGALAYGWPFASEPIGGVTPFARMLRIEGSAPPPAALAGRPQLAALLDAARAGALGDALLEWLLPAGAPGLAPLPVALAAGGLLQPDGGGWLAEGWRRLGWVAAPGGGAGSAADGELAPGAMIAAVLVDGDATLAAGGTVTEVRGDRVWAFGHPFLGTGAGAVPLARAQVVAVLPSLMSSFKFFTVGGELGAMVADRRDGIVGRLGDTAPMVPIRIAVDGEERSFRAVRHPVLLPLLAAYLSQASQSVRGRAFGDQTVTARIELRYPGHQPTTLRFDVSSGQAAAEAAAFVGAVLAYLEASPFAGPPLESLSVGLDSAERLRAATILEVVPSRRVVRPGERIDLRFRLKPHRGPEEVRVLTLQVPPGVPDGRLDVVGADGAAWTAYELRMRPRRSASFGDELALLAGLVPASTLVAALERPDSGVALPGGSLSTPPGIALQLASALGPNLETTSYSVVAEAREAVGVPVAGAQRVTLTVRAGDRGLE